MYSPAARLKQQHLCTLPSEQPRILVVDDEPSLRRLNRAPLMNNGYQVNTAADGQTGWERKQTSSYDLLITDFNMPDDAVAIDREVTYRITLSCRSF